jgi:hypothetical protein
VDFEEGMTSHMKDTLAGGFEVLLGYIHPENIQSFENVHFPAVYGGPAAGEHEPQGRHCGGPHWSQKGTAIFCNT